MVIRISGLLAAVSLAIVATVAPPVAGSARSVSTQISVRSANLPAEIERCPAPEHRFGPSDRSVDAQAISSVPPPIGSGLVCPIARA